VEIAPMIVLNVLMKLELQNQPVTVLPEDIITELMLNVHFVTKDVPNVKQVLLTVPDVTQPEKPILTQFVHVNHGNTMTPTTNVRIVHSDVLLVKVLLIIVLLVLISEPQPPLVHVQTNITKPLENQFVMNVVINVENVQLLLVNVISVLKKESNKLQIAHVQPELSKLVMSVPIVTGDVKLVKKLPQTVSNVALVSEIQFQTVHAKMDIPIVEPQMLKPLVNLVDTDVTLVT
jgi:hypothetical protein